MQRLTRDDMTEAEQKDFDEYLGHLVEYGYPEVLAESVAIDHIANKRAIRARETAAA
jgi:hypothetical protein